MSIGVSAAAASLIGGGLAAAGGIGGSLIGAHSASSAAQQQQSSAQQAIDEQKRQFDITQANLAPWLGAGKISLDQLTSGTAPGGPLVTPYSSTFVAPTLDNTNDPGYAFRLQQSQQALTRAQLASGGAFNGGTLAALTRYGQDYASNEYQNVYSRALQGFNTNFNVYNTGQTNQFNRLAAIAGLGQNATNQLAATGSNTANTVSDLLTQQGNAAAAGTLGTGSAINSGIQSAFGNLGNAFGTGAILNLLTGSSAKAPLPLPTQTPRFNLSSLITGTNPASYGGINTGYEGM